MCEGSANDVVGKINLDVSKATRLLFGKIHCLVTKAGWLAHSLGKIAYVS